MDIPHIRDQIFDQLNHETVLICRQVCKFWNESLRSFSDVIFLGNWENPTPHSYFALVYPKFIQSYSVQQNLRNPR